MSFRALLKERLSINMRLPRFNQFRTGKAIPDDTPDVEEVAAKDAAEPKVKSRRHLWRWVAVLLASVTIVALGT